MVTPRRMKRKVAVDTKVDRSVECLMEGPAKPRDLHVYAYLSLPEGPCIKRNTTSSYNSLGMGNRMKSRLSCEKTCLKRSQSSQKRTILTMGSRTFLVRGLATKTTLDIINQELSQYVLLAVLRHGPPSCKESGILSQYVSPV